MRGSGVLDVMATRGEAARVRLTSGIGGTQQAIRSQFAIHNTQLTVRNTHHPSPNTQHATRNSQHATRNTQFAIHQGLL
jgi:hypothetical protein